MPLIDAIFFAMIFSMPRYFLRDATLMTAYALSLAHIASTATISVAFA